MRILSSAPSAAGTAGAAAWKHADAAGSSQAAEDHGPPKRARIGARLTPTQMQEEILPVLEQWMEAVRSSADLMDGEMCSKVLAELGRLQEEVRTNTFSGDVANLRAIAECPFPRAFLDIVKEIDDFEGKPLLECVAASVAIEQRIAQGRLPHDSGGLGQGMMASLAEKKAQEVERFQLRVERQQSEHEHAQKREQIAANRRVPALEAAEKSLREMRAEESRIRLELAKVHAEAAQQRGILEKLMTEEEGKNAASGGDRSLTAVRKSAYDGPEIKLASDDLLRARGNSDRALENTEAAGQHLNFVCHVAEFLREARILMTAQCDEVLQDTLQQEIMMLQQDRQVCQNLIELKNESEKLGSEEANGSSLEGKYRKFYIEQLKSVNARQLRSRLAAMSLIASVKKEPGAGDSVLLEAAAQVVQAVNEQRANIDLEALQSELPDEVPDDKRAGMLVSWPLDQDGQGNMQKGSIRAEDVTSLQGLQDDPRVQGRVSARGCRDEADERSCKLAQASHTLPPVPEHLIPLPLGCLCSAMGELCKGNVRAAFCMLPELSLMAEVGGITKSGAASVMVSLLNVALLHARAEYFWLRKIAIIDCSDPSSETGLAGQSPLADDPDLLVISPLAITASLAADEAESSLTGGRWKAGFAGAVQQIADFRPQVMIYYLGGRPASAALHSGVLDSDWTGRWAKTIATKHSSGRALIVCNHAQTLSDFLLGMAQSPKLA